MNNILPSVLQNMKPSKEDRIAMLLISVMIMHMIHFNTMIDELQEIVHKQHETINRLTSYVTNKLEKNPTEAIKIQTIIESTKVY